MNAKVSPEVRARVRAELNNALLAFPIRFNPIVAPESRDKWSRFVDSLLYEKRPMLRDGQAMLDGEAVEDLALRAYITATANKHLLPQQDAQGARVYYPMLPKVRRSREEEGRAFLSALGAGSETVEGPPLGWWTSAAKARDEREAAAKEAARPRTDRELAERQVALLEELAERAKPQHEKDAARAAELEATFNEAAKGGALGQDEDELRLGLTMGSGVRAHHEAAHAAAREQLQRNPGDEAAAAEVQRREAQL